MMARLGSNQSETSKDNRYIVLEWSHDLIYIFLTQFVHVTHFDQSQRSKLKTAQIARTNIPATPPTRMRKLWARSDCTLKKQKRNESGWQRLSTQIAYKHPGHG